MTSLTTLHLLLLLLLLNSPEHAQSAPSASEVLNKAMADYWSWRMREYPQSATSLGYHRHDDKLDRFTLQAFKEQRDTVVGFLRDVTDVDESSLNKTEITNLHIFRTELQQFVDGYKFVRYGMLTPVNFLGGVHRDISSWMSDAKYETSEDWRKYEKRLMAFPKQLDDVINLMQEAIRLRRTNHKASMTGVPEQIEGMIKPLNESDFYRPYRDKLNRSSVPEHLRDNLQTRGKMLVLNHINPALSKFKHFLEKEYMKHTRTEYGVWSLEQGQDYYQACLNFHLGFELTPQQIYDIGMREVERISAVIRQILEENHFHGSISEFVSYLRRTREKEFYGMTADQLLKGFSYIINQRIAPKLNTVVTVKEDFPIRPTYSMMALTLHEASPGHHLQVSVARQQPTPDFRRLSFGDRYYAPPFYFPWYTAYSEGWGLYSEYLGEEMGLYNQTAMEMFGRYSAEIFRACRLVVDTGIHAMGKSKEWAIEFIANHTVMPTRDIHVEVNRYITWPGQACAYKIGELEIKRMRNKAEETLGVKFDVRHFHDVILRTGQSPLVVVGKAVDDYILNDSSTAQRTTNAAPSTGCDVIVVMTTLLLWRPL